MAPLREKGTGKGKGASSKAPPVSPTINLPKDIINTFEDIVGIANRPGSDQQNKIPDMFFSSFVERTENLVSALVVQLTIRLKDLNDNETLFPILLDMCEVAGLVVMQMVDRLMEAASKCTEAGEIKRRIRVPVCNVAMHAVATCFRLYLESRGVSGTLSARLPAPRGGTESSAMVQGWGELHVSDGAGIVFTDADAEKDVEPRCPWASELADNMVRMMNFMDMNGEEGEGKGKQVGKKSGVVGLSMRLGLLFAKMIPLR
ncbi:hypothetical protein OQA88_11073 [Cercophora sp. LCS_1]